MFFLQKKMGKRLVSVLIVIIIAGLLTACSSSKNEDGYAADGFAMGTVISQKVYGTNAQVAIEKVTEKMNYLEGLLTFNAPEGDIYKLNNNAGKAKVELDSETITIIAKAQHIAEISNGAFDITVGPLVKSWGIGKKEQFIPSREELQTLLPLINYKDLDVDNHLVSLKKEGQMVDLGGIAKGYAGDVAIQIYKEYGIKSGFISIGGNVVTIGGKPDGSPWKVGIRNPRPIGSQSGQNVGIVSVKDKAVVTAGDDQRYFEKDNQRYHHILDPKTGYPAKSDLMSVTLIADSSLDADALDTAVFILGLEKGMELINQYGGVEAVFITTDKKVYVTEGLKDNFIFHDESNQYQYIE